MGSKICNAGQLASDELFKTIVLRICYGDIIIEANKQDARASELFEGNKGYVSMNQSRVSRSV